MNSMYIFKIQNDIQKFQSLDMKMKIFLQQSCLSAKT